MKCAWTLRDGSPCRKVAEVEGLCGAHAEMWQALEAEEAARADRGERPMTARERDRFLKRFSHARKLARKQFAQGPTKG